MGDEAEQRSIRLAQAGDPQAFASLVDRYWDRIYRWLYGLTRSSHTAEDLTQEAFLKAWKAIGTFQAGTNFRSWLFRIARNCLIDNRRDRAAQAAGPLPDRVAANEPGPVADAVGRESVRRIEEACAKLPEALCEVFLLRIQASLSFAEIADVLGITPETCRWRMFKARQLLLKELGPHLD